MQVIATKFPEAHIIQPTLHRDERGFFFESFNQRQFQQLTGIQAAFVQDNHTRSSQHVLRGLHYQLTPAQGKMIRVVVGEVLDVIVDLRRSSATFGQSMQINLSAENHLQLWVPPGFAHGFLVLSEVAEVVYKTTDYWNPVSERCIQWNDPDLAIDWQLEGAPILSKKDQLGIPFSQAEVFI
jgi:dTDP-4-dehydrorhamnose 3,5-epimerase